MRWRVATKVPRATTPVRRASTICVEGDYDYIGERLRLCRRVITTAEERDAANGGVGKLAARDLRVITRYVNQSHRTWRKDNM